jgi:hypothetical protein
MCPPARAVAGVAFVVLVPIVLEAFPHLVNALVSSLKVLEALVLGGITLY